MQQKNCSQPAKSEFNKLSHSQLHGSRQHLARFTVMMQTDWKEATHQKATHSNTKRILKTLQPCDLEYLV